MAKWITLICSLDDSGSIGVSKSVGGSDVIENDRQIVDWGISEGSFTPRRQLQNWLILDFMGGFQRKKHSNSWHVCSLKLGYGWLSCLQTSSPKKCRILGSKCSNSSSTTSSITAGCCILGAPFWKLQPQSGNTYVRLSYLKEMGDFRGCFLSFVLLSRGHFDTLRRNRPTGVFTATTGVPWWGLTPIQRHRWSLETLDKVIA